MSDVPAVGEPIVSASFVLRFAGGVQHTFDIGEGHDITFRFAAVPELSELTPFGKSDRFEPPVGRSIDVRLQARQHRWDAELTRTVDGEHTLSRAELERLVQAKVNDILAVLESHQDTPPRLEDVAFGVATGPNSQGRWFPFEPGEVYLVDRREDWDGTPSGRELAGDGRRPYKWSVQVEVFDSLAEARARSAEVKARRGR